MCIMCLSVYLCVSIKNVVCMCLYIDLSLSVSMCLCLYVGIESLDSMVYTGDVVEGYVSLHLLLLHDRLPHYNQVI